MQDGQICWVHACVTCDMSSACLISVQPGEQVFNFKELYAKIMCHILGGGGDLKVFRYGRNTCKVLSFSYQAKSFKCYKYPKCLFCQLFLVFL